MKSKKDNTSETKANDSRDKQMILKLDPAKHSWVKAIADSAPELSMPKVINLILGEATKTPPTHYIEQIQKMHAKEALKKLDEDAENMEIERKRLKDLLEG